MSTSSDEQIEDRVQIAWVFPGQGSLRTGCLAAATSDQDDAVLAPLADAAAATVATLERAIGRDLRALSDDPTAGARTADAQPTILAASLAAAAALRATGLRPDVVAGHSLGECTAAIAAGALEVAAGGRVVQARGSAMGAACAANPGAMAAVVKLAPEAVTALLAGQSDVVVANDNAPGQVVVAGPPAAVAALKEHVREAGGRLVPLEVEGAFHSPAMSPAVAALSTALDAAPIADPTVPLISGVQGKELTTGTAIADALLGGVLAPVRWRAVQAALAARGISHLVEVGPGGVLAGLAKRTIDGVEIHTVATPADAHQLAVHLGALATTH